MAAPLAVKLAWRSLLRHRRRSAITGAAIALGLAMMLIFVGIADDGHDRMAELGIRMGSGHVVVEHAGYRQEPTLDHLVDDPAPVIAAARRVAGVEVVVPRLRAQGLISAGDLSAPVMVAGVDPAVEPRASLIPAPGRRVRGAYLRPRRSEQVGVAPADIYLGKGLAEKLGVDLGDRVVLTVSPREAGRPASAAFIVRGIFRTGVGDLDGFYAEIPLVDAVSLLRTGGGVTEVALILDGLRRTEPARRALRAALAGRPGLAVLPWQEVLPELYEAIVLDDGGLYIMMAIIFVIVGIGIFNAVLMSVLERTKEFGVMLALGTGRALLFRVVLLESAFLGVLGAAVGLAIGLGLHALVAAQGIDIGALSGTDYEIAGIAIEGGFRIYSRLSVAVVGKWTLVVMAMTAAAALYPAARAARLTPVEAMRHV